VKDDVRYVALETLLELKLASGMANPNRLCDLGDVVSMIGAVPLSRELGDRLHPWVQAKWFDIWDRWSAEPRKDDY
jgi:hypothetical protein